MRLSNFRHPDNPINLGDLGYAFRRLIPISGSSRHDVTTRQRWQPPYALGLH